MANLWGTKNANNYVMSSLEFLSLVGSHSKGEHQLKSECIHNTVAVRDIIRDNHQVQDILGVINIKAHDSRPDKHLVTLVPLLKERLTYANFLTNFWEKSQQHNLPVVNIYGKVSNQPPQIQVFNFTFVLLAAQWYILLKLSFNTWTRYASTYLC